MLRIHDILMSVRHNRLPRSGPPTKRHIEALEELGLGTPPDDVTFAEACAVLTARSVSREVLNELGSAARITRAVRFQLEPYVMYLIVRDRHVLAELMERNEKRWGFCRLGQPPPTQQTRFKVFSETNRLIAGVPYAKHGVFRPSQRAKSPARPIQIMRNPANVRVPPARPEPSIFTFLRSLIFGRPSAKLRVVIDNSAPGTKSEIAKPETFAGRASVIDGDTMDIHGQRIRIWGIDAPEGGQLGVKNGRQWRCGHDCAQALVDFIGSETVHWTRCDQDEFGRIVGRCNIRGRDVGDWMVRNGWALDYPQFSNGCLAPMFRTSDLVVH
jgi:endonuclease YncB( thermonuclease family)